ncbi:MAG TPA: DUF2231 domain-containing protein [Myxococcales bacterium]
MVPALPSLDGLHPLVVHFPIALLLVVPLLVLVAALRRGDATWLAAALLLLGLGTLGAWLSVESGEAAGQMAERTPAVDALLEKHESLARATAASFTALFAALAALLAAPKLLRRQLSTLWRVAPLVVYLLAHAGATTLLVQAAHQGGRLVHEQGVHALMPADGP